MNAKETRRYEMLLRVRDFGDTYREALSGSSAARKAFATVADALNELQTLGVVKLSASASGRAGGRRAARRALTELLAAVSRLARILRAEGQTTPAFSRAKSRSDQALLTTARHYAKDVEPYAGEFDDHEVGPARIVRAIDVFEAALRGRGLSHVDLTASRTRIHDLLRRAELAARRLDLIIGNRPETEAAVQVVWKQARRIESRRTRTRRDTRSTETIGRRNLLVEGVVAVVPSLPHRPLAALPAAATPSQ